jgi:ComF family protein
MARPGNLTQVCRAILRGPCPACGTPRAAPLCPGCRVQSGVADCAVTTGLGSHELRFVGAYRQELPRQARRLSPLGRCLRAFKDHGDRYAGRCLSGLFADACAPLVRAQALIVPVPSDQMRLRQRALSPASWLARGLSRRCGAPMCTTALRRAAGRPPQRGLSGEARRVNAAGAFALGDFDLRGYSVVLVDDVLTTGATLGDAARCLSRAGAARVTFAVLACADEDVITACRSRTERVGRSAIARPPG